MTASDVTVRLPEPLKERINAEIVRCVDDATTNATDRNELFQSYYEMAEGIFQQPIRGPWSNSCTLTDPIVREHILGIVAYIVAQVGSPPYWDIEAVNPEDMEAAERVYKYLTVKSFEWRVKEQLYDVIYNSTVFPFAPVYVAWEQKVKNLRATLERNAEGEVGPVGTIDDGIPQQIVQQVVAYEGPFMHVIQPTDFYVEPWNVQDIQRATRIVWAHQFTKEELIAGVAEYGWDKDAIRKIVLHGPDQPPSDMTKEQNENDGIYQEEMYTVHLVIGRVPIFMGDDGDSETPDWLQNEDWSWWVHSETKQVFYDAPWTREERGFGACYIYRKPGRMYGACIPSLLEDLQNEANYDVRFRGNIKDITCSPVLKVSERQLAKRSGWQVFPGAKVPYMSNPNEIEVLNWPMQAITVVGEIIADHRMRATELVSAQGIDNIQPNTPPTATQSNIVAQGSVNKRDLFLGHICSFIEWMGQQYVNLIRENLPETGDSVYYQNEPIDVSPDDFDKAYRFIPHVNVGATSPQARIQKWMAAKTALQQSAWYAQQVQGGNVSADYYLTRAILEDIGIPNIDKIMGDPPQDNAGLQQAVLQGVQVMMMAANDGNEAAAQAIAVLNAFTQGAANGASGMAGSGAGQRAGQPGGVPTGNAGVPSGIRPSSPSGASPFGTQSGTPAT